MPNFKSQPIDVDAPIDLVEGSSAEDSIDVDKLVEEDTIDLTILEDEVEIVKPVARLPAVRPTTCDEPATILRLAEYRDEKRPAESSHRAKGNPPLKKRHVDDPNQLPDPECLASPKKQITELRSLPKSSSPVQQMMRREGSSQFLDSQCQPSPTNKEVRLTRQPTPASPRRPKRAPSDEDRPEDTDGRAKKHKPQGVIDLTLDEDREIRKDRKQTDESDSDDDYNNGPTGLDVDYAPNWYRRPGRKVDDESAIVDIMEDLRLESSAPTTLIWQRHPRISTDRGEYRSPPRAQFYQGSLEIDSEESSRDRAHRKSREDRMADKSPRFPENYFVWEALRMSVIPRPKPRGMHLDARRPPLGKDLYNDSLTKVGEFNAAGAVGKIIQRQGWITVASSVVGGNVDYSKEEPNDYNKDGTLIVWHESAHKTTMQKLAHCKIRTRGRHVKHYSVNSVAYDPMSATIASSGNDKKVRFWDLVEPEGRAAEFYDESELVTDVKFSHVPLDLAFKPGTSLLAVGEHRRVCFFPSISPDVPPFSVDVVPSNCDHNVGALVWGSGPTSSILFTSSEPQEPAPTNGFHKALDVENRRVTYSLEANEAGDAIGIDRTGSTLALATRTTKESEDGQHTVNHLRLFDIRRNDGKAIQSIPLAEFPRSVQGEVSAATFSPDNYYLAFARSDNRTQVYDCRNLSKGILYDFRHTGTARMSPGNLSYGIVKAEWVESSTRRLGLVTGGDDGCVRLWDPLVSAENTGTILAQANADIGYFSLGDRFKGEYDLVVGDNDGAVSIYKLNGMAS